MNRTKMNCLLILFFIGTSAAAAADGPADVILFEHGKVDEAFSKGQMLLANSHYKVLAGRRVEPGAVEVHEHDTDIIYVTEGSATFVTGGTLIDSRTENPGEIRAKRSAGGIAHHLTKGDVIIVPKGIPHWFSEVSGTFLYFVVKVTE
jgi:glc operon protein GlcG